MGQYAEIAEAAALLGTLFYNDPTKDESGAIFAWLADENTPASWPYAQPQAAECLRAMAKESKPAKRGQLHRNYNRFFVGPYKLPAPAWGSVYTDPDGVIFGNETLAVRQWMRDNLVTINLRDREPEDQFGLILLMASWAITNDVNEGQIRVLFEDHLLPWCDHFLKMFIEAADDENPEPPMASVPSPEPAPFYAACGRLTQATLADWTERFGWTARRCRSGGGFSCRQAERWTAGSGE